MPSRPKRFIILLVIGCVVAVYLLVLFAFRSGASKRKNPSAQAIIRIFETSPSQATADALVRMLDWQEVTTEQAEAILKLLFTPKVIAREAYPLGQKCWISVQHNYRIKFRHMQVSSKRSVWSNGENQYGGSSSGRNSFGTNPQLLKLHPTSEEPGIYQMELRYEFLIIPTNEQTKFEWPSRGLSFPDNLLPSEHTYVTPGDPEKPLYQCKFTVPVDITVVETKEAETIELVTNPELDRRMLFAFTSRPAQMSGSYSNPDKRLYNGGLEIRYTNIPADVSFRFSYITDKGVLLVTPPGQYGEAPIRLRAGTSGSFHITPKRLWVDVPGQYNGTVVLGPDPNSGYEDPAMKKIWGGELNFPFSFTVENENED